MLDSFELKEGATRLLIEAALPANRAARTKLAIGESVVGNNEKEAARLRSTMRRLYQVVSALGTPSHPPHRIESRENALTGQITMTCYWLKP